MTIIDWIPQVVVGLSFITLACLKFYGLYRGLKEGRKAVYSATLRHLTDLEAPQFTAGHSYLSSRDWFAFTQLDSSGDASRQARKNSSG